MSVDLFDRDRSCWKTDDPGWVRQRKLEWLKIRYRLSLSNLDISKPMADQMQRYFIFGDVDFPGYNFEEGIADEFVRGSLSTAVLQIWFFPADLDRTPIYLSENYRFKLVWDRQNFESVVYDRIRDNLPPSETHDYGVMGGRERAVVRFLNPELDYRKEFRFGERLTAAACLTPHRVFERCSNDSRREFAFRESARAAKKRKRGFSLATPYVPYSPGIYLWDHLDYAMEHYPEELHDGALREYPERAKSLTYKEKVKRREAVLHSVLQQLLLLCDEAASSEAWNGPESAALATELLERYEERRFCDALLERWDEAARSL